MRLRYILPLLLLLLISSSLALEKRSLETLQDDSDDDNTCMSKDGYYECDEGRCACPFFAFNYNILQNLSFASPLFTFILIIGFIMVKELREQPGDFFIGFAIAEAALGLTSVFEVIHDRKNNYGVTVQPEICVGIAALRVFLRRTIRIYHVSFVIYYLISLRYSLKNFNVPLFFYHLVPWFTGFFLVGLQYCQGVLGKSLQGTCDLKSSAKSSVYIIELALYFFCFILSTCLIPRLLRKTGNVFPQVKKHFQYYLSYFIFANLLLSVTFVAKFYESETFDKYIRTEDPKEAEDYILNTFLYEQAVMMIDQISPIILTVVRLFDPFLRKHWIKLFKRIFCRCRCCRRRKQKGDDLDLSVSQSPTDLESSLTREREQSLDLRQMTTSLTKKSFLVQAQHNHRIQVVYSFLAAIHYHWKNLRRESMVASASKDDAYYNKKAKAKTHHYITDELIDSTLPEIIKEVRKKNHSILPGKLTVYAPDIFEEITQMDGMTNNLLDSLDLGKNYNRILKSGKAQGGRGGEFFFFSNDNRLILKTANSKELKTLLGILPRYSRHFELNPKSIIAKIYAVFTFEIKDPYEEYHLILMKNVNGYPSHCVERKYDLKGSTVDRSVLEQDVNLTSGFKFAGIMKDIDFDKYEERLHIEESFQYDLLDTLVRDVAFFRMEGLIDYSLVVYLVDKSKLGNTESIEKEEDAVGVSQFRESNNSGGSILTAGAMAVAHPLLSIKSTKEELHYHIGIIDYLSKYDWKKRVEKFYKQMKALNFGLDTSCQDPHTYNKRFLGYMEKIILESYVVHDNVPVTAADLQPTPTGIIEEDKEEEC